MTGERFVIDRIECEVGPVVMNLAEPRCNHPDAPGLPWAYLGRCHLRFIFPGGAVRSKVIYARHQYADEAEWGDLDQVAGQEAVYAEILRHLARHGIEDAKPEVQIGENIAGPGITSPGSIW